MTERTVSVGLEAKVSGFVAGFRTASANVREFNSELSKSSQKRQALADLGGTAGKIGLVATAGLGAAVMASANFDKAMSSVQAATHESADAMEDLRQAALDAGADTVFSASEAAGGIEALAKAGVQTADILGGGLAGALDLAAAGELGVQEAAEAAAGAMAQFNLEGSQVPHIADLLAAGAGKAQGEVSDMVMALKQGGTVAAQMGLTLEETTGALAAFAEQSLLGSDAGTSFKQFLAGLTPNSVKAKELMDELGFSAFNAQGEFVGMSETAGRLREALSGMTDEQRLATLETLFGSDAVRAASIVYDQGADGIQSWIDKTNDAGYAAETAAIKLDNLAGDVEALKGSLETALIGTGDGAQGPLRTLVQGATDAVNAFNKLPGPVKDVAFSLTAITAVTGSGLWFGAKVVTGISDTRKALQDLNVSSPRTASALGKVGRAANVAGIALAGLAAVDLIQSFGRDSEVVPGVEALTKGLLELSNAASGAAQAEALEQLDELLSVKVERSLAPDKVYEFADSLNRLADPNLAQGVQDTVSGFLGGFGGGSELEAAKDQIEGLDSALANIAASGGTEAAAAALDSFAEAAGLSEGEVETLMGLLPGYNEAIAGAANQTLLAAGATDDLTDASRSGATAAMNYTEAIEANTKAMEERRTAAIEAFDAETAWRQALKDATAQAKDNNAGIKGNSKAALENRDALSSLAAAWNDQSAKAQNAEGAMREARKAFIDAATGMGVSEEAARRLARQMLEIKPRNVTATVDTSQAHSALDGLIARLTRFDQSSYTTSAHVAAGVPLPKRAMGGPVAAGRAYLVGENGPEVMTTAANGFVTSNHDLRRMLAAPGGGSAAVGAELRYLRETVARLEESLAGLPDAVRVGTAEGSRLGTEGRFRSFDSAPYQMTGGPF